MTKESYKIIMGAGKYNIFNTLNELKKNRPLVESYLKGDVVEGFHTTKDVSPDGMMGMGIGLWLSIVVVAIGLWVWAVVVTVKYFNVLPVWAQILAVLGLLGFGRPGLFGLGHVVGSSRRPRAAFHLGFCR